ncbi:ABC transporter substrate-binding protein [Microlunatus parietis]|uniref:Multiple sugar transport system substrate-binding protein n=1 Tax=Microlunatus parietis TaxID=682979 RepID=A0A7Y9I5F7_9ACTN|nr:sugar ABC transporter substrate-binding protein [Microlunatus parietis]NYE70642.1 multiple sugar transport system substrate-binding protein [Microlunatus parietis]
MSSPGASRTTLTRRRALGLLGGTAAGAGLAGCSPGGPGGDEVKFMYYGDAQSLPRYQKLFADFNQLHPEIKLKASNVPADNWAGFANAITTRIAGGLSPDIVDIATEGQRIFSSKGLLEPLDPYLQRDKAELDDFFADLNPTLRDYNLRYGSAAGTTTYFLPGGFNTMALYVNVDTFRKAGVEPPEEDWTWAEFRAAGQALRDKAGAFLVPVDEAYFVCVMPWLTTNGGSTFNADWTEPTFDSEPAIEAARFAKSLVDEGLSPKPGGEFDAPTQLARGKLGCLPAGRWVLGQLQDLKLIDRLRVVPWPIKVGRGTPVGWNAFPILKESRKKEEAWTFLKFLVSRQNNSFFATGTSVPPRRSGATSAEFLDNAPEGSRLFFDSMEYATPIPSPDRGPEAQTIIEEAWLSVITGNREVVDGLRNANERLRGLL